MTKCFHKGLMFFEVTFKNFKSFMQHFDAFYVKQQAVQGYTSQ